MPTNVVLNGVDSALTSVLGTIGTAATTILSSASVAGPYTNGSRQYLKIHNPNATAVLAYTIDGSTPVVNGNGFTLGPLGEHEYDSRCPQGAVTLIGSTAGVDYSILVG